MVDAVRSHYLSIFGEPTRRGLFVSRDGPRIEIMKWDPIASGEDVNIYATAGACVALDAAVSRCEFFMGLLPEADDVAGCLAEVAMHGLGNRQMPGYGSTIRLSSPLWRGSQMQSVLVTSNGVNLIPHLKEPVHVEFLQLVPLYPEELHLVRDRGEEYLWKGFRKAQVRYWNPYRDRYVEAV